MVVTSVTSLLKFAKILQEYVFESVTERDGEVSDDYDTADESSDDDGSLESEFLAHMIHEFTLDSSVQHYKFKKLQEDTVPLAVLRHERRNHVNATTDASRAALSERPFLERDAGPVQEGKRVRKKPSQFVAEPTKLRGSMAKHTKHKAPPATVLHPPAEASKVKKRDTNIARNRRRELARHE